MHIKDNYADSKYNNNNMKVKEATTTIKQKKQQKQHVPQRDNAG